MKIVGTIIMSRQLLAQTQATEDVWQRLLRAVRDPENASAEDLAALERFERALDGRDDWDDD